MRVLSSLLGIQVEIAHHGTVELYDSFRRSLFLHPKWRLTFFGYTQFTIGCGVTVNKQRHNIRIVRQFVYEERFIFGSLTASVNASRAGYSFT